MFCSRSQNLDMDALGSAVGMQLFASNVIENSYALYDEEQMSPDIERAVSFIEKKKELRSCCLLRMQWGW